MAPLNPSPIAKRTAPMAETAAAGRGGATHGRHGSLPPRAGSIWPRIRPFRTIPARCRSWCPVQASVAPQDARTTESGPDHSPVVNPSGPAQVPDVGATPAPATEPRRPIRPQPRNLRRSCCRPRSSRPARDCTSCDGRGHRRQARADRPGARGLRPRRGGTAPGRLRHSRRQLHRRPPRTLQLLQRDARVVNDMLSAAGFTVDQGGLDFTLRDPGGRDGGGERQPGAHGRADAEFGAGAAPSSQRDRTVAACWTCRFDMRAHSAPRRQ